MGIQHFFVVSKVLAWIFRY